MLTIKVPYTFRNGIHVDFTIQKNIKNPIAKAEWNIALTKEFWKAIEKAIDFLKTTQYELDENGLCFSPVRLKL